MATVLTAQDIHHELPQADSKAIAAHIKNTLCSKVEKQHAEQGLSSVSFDYANGTLRLAFPHDILKAWFLENEANTLTKIVQQYPTITGIEYTVRSTLQTKSQLPLQKMVVPEKPMPRHTFSDFITNAKNDFPFTLCQAVANQNKPEFNPLVLYGKNGRGKTHLLEAILEQMGASATYGFWSNISRLHEFFIQHKRDSFFSVTSTYRFLFLDDFHEIIDFPDLQSELVSLFDAFVAQQKQMVFSTSVPVNDFTDMLPQLKSRLLSGLIVSLKKPDIDIKLRFIQRENKRRSLELNEEQIFYLVRQFDDFRSLKGSLLKIAAYKQLVTSDLSRAQFKSIVSGIANKNQVPEAEKIIKAVCDHYQVSLEDIRSSKRKKNIAGARQVAIFLCRKHLGISFPALGSMFGNKDHTTALYSFKKIEHRAKKEPELKKELARIYAAAKN